MYLETDWWYKLQKKKAQLKIAMKSIVSCKQENQSELSSLELTDAHHRVHVCDLFCVSFIDTHHCAHVCNLCHTPFTNTHHCTHHTPVANSHSTSAHHQSMPFFSNTMFIYCISYINKHVNLSK